MGAISASATEIVCALGCGEMLVGRSHECDNPAWVRRLRCCNDATFGVSVSGGEIDMRSAERWLGGLIRS